MKLHHLRNATLIIEAGDNVILVDPMLGGVGTIPPFSFFRYKAKRNPLVALPGNSLSLLNGVTHCLITHLHPDHLDKDGISFLKSKNIPVICSVKDEKALRKQELNIITTLEYWKPQTFLDGKITGIPAIHGYGFIAGPMGNVIGYHLELPEQPSIYISADTVYTEHVDKALKELKPEIAVLACGTARLDIGKSLLMTMEDILTFVTNAPQKVFANHMEALNHCPTTRQQLKDALRSKGLLDKVFVPNDGEMVVF